MDYRDLNLYETQYEYRVQEKMQRAEHQRLVNSVVSRRRWRFYDRTIARFGRWLMVYGYRLRKHYGERRESSTSQQPIQRGA